MTCRFIVKKYMAALVGGHPVAVYLSADKLPADVKTRLARECTKFESTFLTKSASDTPIMSYYLPSGKEISYSHDAALCGTEASVANGWGIPAAGTQFGGDRPVMNKKKLTIEPINDTSTIRELLDLMGFSASSIGRIVDNDPVVSGVRYQQIAPGIPHLCNASLDGEVKTYINVGSLDYLSSASDPMIDTGDKYRQLCSQIESNGVILFVGVGSDKNHVLFGHNQFPLITGFPNTLMSVSTLAACLDGGNTPRDKHAYSTFYNISNIDISGIENDGEWTTFHCDALVELGEPESIKIV